MYTQFINHKAQILWATVFMFFSVSSFILVHEVAGQNSPKVKSDFNGDGFADLAVGIDLEDIDNNNIKNAGVVNVLYGSARGLSATDNQLWHQDSKDILGKAKEDDRFGSALAAGDFDGDGFADLAVGVPNEEVAGIFNAGAVNVLYGSTNGLSATDNQIWNQNSPQVEGKLNQGEGFGSALAAGDFNGDGFADLAVGVPNEEVAGISHAGAVNVLYGSTTGLSAKNNQIWTDKEIGAGDLYGSELTMGDFNNDGFDDLVVGVPNEVHVVAYDGVVHILYGSADGLSNTGKQIWSQNKPGIKGGGTASFERFGAALAAGDFNGDNRDDLAVGVPFENSFGKVVGGAVNVLP